MVREFENKNQWALILGGSSGLGLASAKKLATHGLNICIVYRCARSQEEHVMAEFEQIKQQGVDFVSFNADALHPEKLKMMIAGLTEKWHNPGKIRVLVHSIAKGNLKPMVSADAPVLQSADFALTIHAMATSLYEWTSAIFEAGLFAKDTRIISFTSEGNSKAWKSYAAVSAAKATLEAVTRNIALEFAPYGIKANCIQAGVTDTMSMRAIPGSEVLKEHALTRNPHHRLTLPEDVANVVYLLCKDEAAWINGVVIPVDGGEHLC
ncbi:MAG: SDR family oxidoreductase [Cyclobacteriaceae bacterium]|nr:SDR family oxidoreductase [Cyclobacteriaceae bacterium]